MKNQLTKLLALALATGMLLSMAACKLKEDTAAPDASGEAIAVKIGDQYSITKAEIAETYDAMLQQYSAYGMPAPTAAADIESMQDSVVDMLVTKKLNAYQAELMGIKLDEEVKNGVDADVEDEMAYYMDMFRSQAETEGAADVAARTEEIFKEQLASAGLDMDMSGYREYIREELTKEALSKALETKVKADVSVTDEEVQTYFDDLLATQKETYAKTPANYLDDEEGYEKYGGDPVLTTPEGFVRVKTITVSPAEELSADHATLMTAIEKLEAEYGKLSLDNVSANAARIKEIVTEYKAKKAEADALFETYISAARAKAEKAAAALKEGKPFDEVLKEYGEDDLYTTYPIFATEGILMQKGAESEAWDPKLVEAVGKLKVGEYTDLINLDDMFYICQLVGDEPTGEKSFNDVKEDIKVQALEQKAEAYWGEQQESWLNDPKLVTYFEDVYRSIGK
ncbi:MAG: peptidyl-prolyl cis-trans isomerase [Clostridia bacterium]